MQREQVVLAQRTHTMLKNQQEKDMGGGSSNNSMDTKMQYEAHGVVLKIIKEKLKEDEETYKGNEGFLKEEVFSKMAKEVDIVVVDKAVKKLKVTEEQLIIIEVKQFLKKIAKAKIKARRFLYKTGVVKGNAKGTRLLVKGPDSTWGPFVQEIVEV